MKTGNVLGCQDTELNYHWKIFSYCFLMMIRVKVNGGYSFIKRLLCIDSVL